MEHQSSFVGGGPRARTTHGKADATTPVNGYLGGKGEGVPGILQPRLRPSLRVDFYRRFPQP